MSLRQQIETAFAAQRFETARRLCLRALAEQNSTAVLYLLHRAHRQLGDFQACRQVLEQIQPVGDVAQCEWYRLLAEDYDALATGDSYRTSSEKDAGLTGEEYIDKYRRIAAAYRAKAGPPHPNRCNQCRAPAVWPVF